MYAVTFLVFVEWICEAGNTESLFPCNIQTAVAGLAATSPPRLVSSYFVLVRCLKLEVGHFVKF